MRSEIHRCVVRSIDLYMRSELNGMITHQSLDESGSIRRVNRGKLRAYGEQQWVLLWVTTQWRN
jgi:hypothetical protein